MILNREVFSTKRAGDYFNSKYIFKLIDVNKDYQSLIDIGMMSTPAFVLYNKSGEKVMQFVSQSYSFGEIVKEINDAYLPKNSLQVREERFAKEDSYAMEYLDYLINTSRETVKVGNIFTKLLTERPQSEMFASEWLNFYEDNCYELDNLLLPYYLENKKALTKVMGKKTYLVNVKEMSNRRISDLVINYMSGSGDPYEDFREQTEEYPFMKTGFTEFVLDNLDTFNAVKRVERGSDEYSEKINDIITLVEGVIFQCRPNMRDMLLEVLIDIQFRDLINPRALEVAEKVVANISNSRERNYAGYKLTTVKRYVDMNKKYLINN